MSLKRGRWSRLLLLATALGQLGIVALAPALDAHVSEVRASASADVVVADDGSGAAAHDARLCAACAVMHAAWGFGDVQAHLPVARIGDRPTAVSTLVVARAAARLLQLPRAPPTDLA